jgi:nucleoside-diphosphate-sugar epimerase
VRGDGKNLIDAMYVDDAVRGIFALLAARDASGAETLDFASRRPVSIAQLVHTAGAAFGIEPRIAFLGQVPEYIEFRSVDRAMEERFGIVPEVSLEDGLRRLAAHLGAPAPDAGPAARS